MLRCQPDFVLSPGLGLSTGLGTSIVDHWRVEPLEIAHLPYRKGKSYEDYLGDAGMKELGDARWEKHVHKVCALFRAALLCDGIVLGGGNARKLINLPDASTRGANENAIIGGIRLWERAADTEPFEFAGAPPRVPATKRPARKAAVTPKRPASKGAKSPRKQRGGAKKSQPAAATRRSNRAR